MVVNKGFVRCALMVTLLLGIGNAYAQDELRKTFFKEADAAKAAADAANAQLLAPRSYERGMKEGDMVVTSAQFRSSTSNRIGVQSAAARSRSTCASIMRRFSSSGV